MSNTFRNWRAALIGTVAALALVLPPGIAQAALDPDKIHQTVLAELATNDNWFDPAGVCPSAAPCDEHGAQAPGRRRGGRHQGRRRRRR